MPRRRLPKKWQQSSRPKRRRRTIAWRKLLVGALVAILPVVLLVGLGSLWFSGILRVNAVSIEGQTSLSDKDVLSAVGDLDGDMMWLVNRQRITEQIEANFPRIGSVAVKKQYFPNRVVISLTEKQPVVRWSNGGQTYELDADGVVIGVVVDYAMPVPGEEQSATTEAIVDPSQETMPEVEAAAPEERLPLIYAFGASPRLREKAQAEAQAQAEAATQAAAEAGEPLPENELPTAEDYLELPAVVPVDVGTEVSSARFIETVTRLTASLPDLFDAQGVRYFEAGEYDDLSVIMDSGLEVRLKLTHTLESVISRLDRFLEEANRAGVAPAEYVDLRFEKVYGI